MTFVVPTLSVIQDISVVFRVPVFVRFDRAHELSVRSSRLCVSPVNQMLGVDTSHASFRDCPSASASVEVNEIVVVCHGPISQ